MDTTLLLAVLLQENLRADAEREWLARSVPTPRRRWRDLVRFDRVRRRRPATPTAPATAQPACAC